MRRRLYLFLFHPFLETMILSKSLISRIFLKPNRLWFQKNDGKYIDAQKMHKMIKKILTPFT